MVMACDGIWEVLENQQVVDFVRERLHGGSSPKAACEALLDRCLAPNTDANGGKGCDNMSVMIIVFK